MGIELLLIVALSIAFGALLMLFYLTVIKDKPIRINYQDKINKLKNDGFIRNNDYKFKEDIIIEEDLVDDAEEKAAMSYLKKHKVAFIVVIILGCCIGSWLGNAFVKDLTTTIYDNHKPITYNNSIQSE